MARPGRRSKSAGPKRRSSGSSVSALGGSVHGGAWSLSGRARRRARPLSFRNSSARIPPTAKKRGHGVRVKNPPRHRKGGKGYNKSRARGAPRNKR